MCGECKEETEFRWMPNKNTWYSYCRNCERLYSKEWKRIYRARLRDEKDKNR